MRWTTVLVSVLVAACGENLVTIDGEGAPKPDDSSLTKSELVHGSRVHVRPMRDPAAVTAAAAPAGAHLNYYGGKIIPNARVYSVNWGTGVNASYVSQLPGFYQAVTNSPEHWDWIAAEYTTVGLNGKDGLPGSNQAFGRGSFVSTINITPASTAATISDATIQSEINAQINAGVLPLPDDNVIFMVNFPKGKTITSPDGAKSCVSGGFCAYHGTFRRGTQNVYYAVLPSNEAGTGCATGCGSSSVPFNNYTSVASHELIEAATDAEVGIGTTVARPLAWYDPTNGEIADICNATQGTITAANGTLYTVQAEFSNATSSCIVTKAPVGNSFTVAVSPSSTTVAAGGTTTVTVNTTVTGTAQSVALSVSGLPAGVTGSFSPATVTAGSSSTLTLTASTSAGAATATYTVTGTGSSLTRTATGSVTVTTTGGSGETVLSNGQTLTGQAGAASQQTFYRVDVPAGVSLTISTSGGTGDADLYVQFGSRPTTASYLCRPYLNGNTETCTVASTQAGSYFVMLNGFSAYSGLSITASWGASGGTGDPTLSLGVPITGLSGASASQKFWQIDVPAGATSLKVAISGGTGDADLYLRAGAHPTTTTYTCRPYLNGNAETCTITNPTAGKWYVMLRAFSAYSGVTLSAN